MKLLSSIVLLSLVFTAGCVRRYEITLTNQRMITSHGRPKEDKAQGVYRFKDAEGRARVVPSIEVLNIEPR